MLGLMLGDTDGLAVGRVVGLLVGLPETTGETLTYGGILGDIVGRGLFEA